LRIVTSSTWKEVQQSPVVVAPPRCFLTAKNVLEWLGGDANGPFVLTVFDLFPPYVFFGSGCVASEFFELVLALETRLNRPLLIGRRL